MPTFINPLKKDPTRTTMIRRLFAADLARRFRNLIVEIKDFVEGKDALGLGPRDHPFLNSRYVDPNTPPKVALAQDLCGDQPLILNVQPREFQFLTDVDKLKAFNAWFKQRVAAGVLSVPEGTDPQRPWTAMYVESAYKMGLVNAYMNVRSDVLTKQGLADISQEQWLRQTLAAPESISKMQLLATRSYEGLSGITAAMGSEMNRIMAQGIADGSSPSTLAKLLSDRITTLTETRALVLARTEIIYVHAEGQLDSFNRLGIQELGVNAEWSTAGDDRVCPQCFAYSGQIFTVKEARGLIPLHPQCRCSWIPSEKMIKPKKQAA